MTIDDWRKCIDEIDAKLVELLNQRSRCAAEIGCLKKQQQIPLYQPEREAEIFLNISRRNGGPLSDAALRRVFERIIDEGRSVERRAMSEDENHKAK